MPRDKNTPREREIRGRTKAFEGARLAQAENISMEAAAVRVGSKRSSVQEAMMILLLGTPEEIEGVEHGNMPMGLTTDAIRDRTTPEERKAKYRKPAYAPEVWQGREFEVHATPLIQPPGCMRQFIKISLSNERYNMADNSHNYLFQYDWEMHDRETIRNDPFKAQHDYISEKP